LNYKPCENSKIGPRFEFCERSRSKPHTMITHDNVFIVKNVGMVDEPHAFEYVIGNMIGNILDVESVHLELENLMKIEII